MFKKKQQPSIISSSVPPPQLTQSTLQQKQYNFAVGNIENSMVTLIDDDYNMIQLYDYLLPDIQPGNILSITIKRNYAEEEARKSALEKLNKLILKEEELMKTNSLLKQ